MKKKEVKLLKEERKKKKRKKVNITPTLSIHIYVCLYIFFTGAAFHLT